MKGAWNILAKKLTQAQIRKSLSDFSKKYDSYVIYGAQVIAVGVREAISHLTGKQPASFAVGKPAGKTWESPTYVQARRGGGFCAGIINKLV